MALRRNTINGLIPGDGAEHTCDDSGIQQGVMRKLFPIIHRRERRRINWMIQDILGPAALIVGKLAEQLPIVVRGVRDDFKSTFEGCQEGEQCCPGLDDRQRVLSSP